MYGQNHFFIILSVIIIDILCNWYYTRKLKKEPLHWLLWCIRAAIAVYVVQDPVLWIWLLKAVNAGFLYWFCFDTGYNIVTRGIKEMTYLDEGKGKGGGAFLDRIQLKYLGRRNAFSLKLLFAIYASANMLYNYNPYYNF